MTQGRATLRSIRIRRESAPGTRATPRFIWRGNGGSLKDEREITNVEERVGIFEGTDRSYVPKLMGALELDETELTFEQASWLFLAAGCGTAAAGYQGSAQGVSGSAVLHLLTIPASVTPPTVAYTIEEGDPEVETQVMPYALIKKIGIKGAGGEAVKVSAELMGRYVEPTNASGTFSAEGTLVQVEVVLAAGSVFLTPAVAGAAFGAGAALVTAGNILGFEVNIEPKWEPKFPVDSGTIYFHTAVYTGAEISGNLTFEHQISGTYGAAGSAGQKAKWRAQDPQLLRLQFFGGTITLGSGGYVNKQFTMDLPIRWKTFDALDDQNGNSIVSGEFYSKYNEIVPAAGRGTITIVQRGTALFDGA